MYEAFGEHGNATEGGHFFGPSGASPHRADPALLSNSSRLDRGVAIHPGATTLTVTPYDAESRAVAG